jgi:Universal stress protein family.
MKTLLMAIDNSPVAEKVIALTIEQALAQQAQVTVLCCVDPAYSSCNQPIEIDAGEDPDDFVAWRRMNKTRLKWWYAMRCHRCCALALTHAG